MLLMISLKVKVVFGNVASFAKVSFEGLLLLYKGGGE
jgi:hypothetical protein